VAQALQQRHQRLVLTVHVADDVQWALEQVVDQAVWCLGHRGSFRAADDPYRIMLRA
jgi:hypothetical protein